MTIKQLLTLFGLSEKEQTVYLLLSQYEWLTVLELAKKSAIKRTTLYRIIDSLMEQGLVEMRIDDKSTYYKATNPSNFESLIIKKEQENHKMRTAIDQLKTQLSIFALPNQQTSVSFYRGIKGIMAIEWKLVSKPNSETLILGNDQWWQIMGEDFAEKVRQETVNNNIKIREILNPETIKTSDLDHSWTKNEQYFKHHYQGKYIAKELVPIEGEFYIKQDTIYIYSLQHDDIVGIEIRNQAYAQMMTSLFEMLWSQAKTLEEIKQ